MTPAAPKGKKKSKGGATAIFWWTVWILLTIGSFFVSSSFWTWFIAERFGSVRQSGISVLWVTAVFGTWMVLLVPLIVLMYAKVDKAYEDSRIRKEEASLRAEQAKFGFKSILVDQDKRALRPHLAAKMKVIPDAIRQGQLVTAILNDGRRIENVFVRNRRDVLGIYGIDRLSFDIGDIVDVEPADLTRLPAFEERRWLRLDGAAPAQEGLKG